MTPITRTYLVELTPEEYDYLYRIAPDGIQAAMAANHQIRYLGSEPERRLLNDRTRSVRETCQTPA